MKKLLLFLLLLALPHKAFALCDFTPAAGAQALTVAAGKTYCFTGTNTWAAAQAINQANVTFLCSGNGTILQRTGTTDLFDVTSSGFKIGGCNIDGASQTSAGTGPLINLNGANDALIVDNYFSNTGTTASTQTGTIWVQAGLRDRIINNTFTTSQTDTAIWVNSQTGTNVVSDLTIEDNKIPTFAPASNLYAIAVNQASGNSSTHIKVNYNDIILTTTHAEGIAWLAQASSQNTAVLGSEVIGNQLNATAAPPRMMHLFGFSYGTVANNIIDDGANNVSGAALDLGDIYNSSITGNMVNARSGVEDGIDCVDCAQNTISGNIVDAVTNTAHDLFVECVSGSADNNAITGNVLRGFQAGANTELQANGCSLSNNTFSGNTVEQSTQESNAIGITLVDTSSTMASNAVVGNTFINFNGTSNAAISVGSGATNTYIGPNNVMAATHALNNSGTTTTTTLYPFAASFTLSTGTLAKAFPLGGGQSVAGTCTDTTTVGNKCTVAFTSATTTATTLTATGTSSDVCQCAGIIN